MADFFSGKVVFHAVAYAPYILNDTASGIWDFCKTPKDTGKIVKYLCKRYGIKVSRAREDIKKFVKELKKRGLIQSYERKT